MFTSSALLQGLKRAQTFIFLVEHSFELLKISVGTFICAGLESKIQNTE